MRNIYGKFYKAMLSFKRIAENKKIRIQPQGKSTALIYMYPIIDILPYLILDNAVKYSPMSGSISVQFSESSDFVDITTSSIGPSLEDEDLDRTFEKGYRGKRVLETNIQGSGRGLSLVKYICDIHDANVR